MSHELYMKRCLGLAQRGKGFTSPNPMVGAVLVHNGRIIAEGWHHRYGEAHAEVDCLDNVPEPDKHLIPECTLYVNLEPCAHHGRTPPCAERLVREGIKKVVIANRDPFDQVRGRGIGILEAAGIDVQTGIMEREGAWLNRLFFCTHMLRRTYIILKWAQTTNGFIAPADRSRFMIANDHSNQLVHKWRTEEAAILVGTSTAINDNPQLTARLWKGPQPLRIILDKNLKVPGTHALYDNTAPTWIINAREDREEGNITFVRAGFGPDLLPSILKRLYDQKILSLIVEGGANLLGQFIESGLWDEARILTGNVALPDGIPAPLLTNVTPAFSTNLDDDMLHVFVNSGSIFQYVQGMQL